MNPKNEELRDPELDGVRTAWDAPTPRPQIVTRMGDAFEREFARPPWFRRWAWALVAGPAVIVLWAILIQRPPDPLPYYVPVAQPRLIVVSQGERP